MPTQNGASILPPRLDALLAVLACTTRYPVVIRGWSADCGDGEHRFERWISGIYLRRDLVLLTCANCATVEVRDVSIDRLPGLATGGRALRRRNALLGWYSGSRRNQRIYQ